GCETQPTSNNTAITSDVFRMTNRHFDDEVAHLRIGAS
ncbi:MAG: hypothetical protein ACI9HA_001614, partial [Dinoroseobacter sp.]